MFQETIKKFMEAVDLQALQCLAATTVAILACESEDTQQMIRRFCKTNDKIGFSDDQWKLLRVNVKIKLIRIGVPDIIIDIILGKLLPVSLEISKWNMRHAGIDRSLNFCWTPQVTIDYEKTAEILVRSESIDTIKRFELACLYCLELQVRSLWEQMSLSERRFFFARKKLKKSKPNPILRYWSYCIQDVPIDYWNNKALNETQLFTFAVRNGYLSATKFFFGKIKSCLRRRMISNCFQCHFYSTYRCKCLHLPIACFLVCQLPEDDEKIRHFLKMSYVFQHFLEWPRQKHFTTVVHRLRDYIHEATFIDLLMVIFKKIIGFFQCHDYKEIFMEFWHLCIEPSKTYVRTTALGYVILMRFVKKNLGFVFEERAFKIKLKFRAVIFQQEIPKNVKDFDKANVEFFVFLVRERLTTKECIENLHSGRYIYGGNIYHQEFGELPVGELMYLMDGILGN